MRKLINLIVIAGLAVVLFYTNPGMDAFKDYVKGRSEQILARETGDNDIGEFLTGLGSSLASSLVDRVTERSNFLVCSLYTIDLDDDDGDGETWRYLGIAGQFIELQGPDTD